MASDMRPQLKELRPDESDPSEVLRSFARLLCLLTGAVVLVFGVYCTWQVFQHLQAVVTDGKPLESAVDSIAALIDAESMVIDNQAQGVKANYGRSLAVVILWLFYSLWIALALGLLKAGGGLVACSFAIGRRA
jgi:hypothetical protein